jgi:DNA primase
MQSLLKKRRNCFIDLQIMPKNKGEVSLMAKTYLSAVKYEVLASYEVQGVVEKPDIVGAIFGQCEGLLGEDMDLKELQQAGKIGRIEITVNKGKGTTSGEVTIPSSLDQVKTSILAATIETVEKVGPFEAKVKVTKIGDTRKEKRDVITDRAKELLKHMQKFEGVESSELAQEIKTDLRTEKIVSLDGLQAGPEVASSPEIIVVEGRADVLKLLSYGINNAVAMNGGNIDTPLIALCKEKVVTVLIDGDRGGELNVKKLASLTKVDFVAKAPDGKEVEELVQKEILMALKRKVPFSEAFNGKEGAQTEAPQFPQRNDFRPNFERREFGHRDNFRPQHFQGGRDNYRGPSHFGGNRHDDRGPRQFGGRDNFRPNFHNGPRDNFRPQHFQGGRDNFRGRDFERRDNFRPNFQGEQFNAPKVELPQEIPKEVEKLRKTFDKLKGKSKATLLDAKKKKIKEVEVKDLLTEVQASKKKVDTVMFDGIITNRLIEAASAKGVSTIIGVKKGNITPNEKIKTYTM